VTAATIQLPTPSDTPQPTTGRPTCRIVNVTQVNGAVVETFVKQTKGYTAVTWMICDEPPSRVCLPIDPLLDLSGSDAGDTRLLDCNRDSCRTMNPISVGKEQLCLSAVIGSGNNPSCAQGCAFALLSESPSAQQPTWLIILPFLIVFIVLGLLARFLLIIFMRRREKKEEEEALEPDLTTS
jgi:hypothetical protein